MLPCNRLCSLAIIISLSTHGRTAACHNISVRTLRDFAHTDYRTMFNYLKLLDWSVVFAACRTVNQYWETLYGILQQLVNECVPMSRPRRNCSQHLPRGVRSFVLRKRKA